ncbi:lipid A-modifier LpxR family protein [Thalassovita sp.]|uniref:lipid A-modifier LpxR family protein n=1 Tax=Thalassovita sp. TaxID=1979401 RepID=UPI002B26D731|nr:lipid A-modifier LpxR family protein [Thalassovita sp.]
MIRFLTAAALGLLLLTSQAFAEERVRLGYGRLITNDFIGDTQDRWHSGSVASSRIYGYSWDGALPEKFGELLEFRINGEIIAPDNLVSPAAGDRPYAGSLSFGLHTHYQRRETDISMGMDMVLTGPMTGLDDFQGALHDALGVDSASAATLSGQIGNGVHPTFVMELGRDYALGQGATLRPFLETRVGVETLLRAGADVTIGQIGRGELLVRDPVSGQRYRTMQNSDAGYTFVLGGDIAKVTDSIYLPTSRGFTLTDSRQRLRAGVHWQGENSSGFYGLTWLGEEFLGQGEGQLIGSVRLNLNF